MRPILRMEVICRRESASANGLHTSEQASPRSTWIAQERQTPLPQDLQTPTAVSFWCAKHCIEKPLTLELSGRCRESHEDSALHNVRITSSIANKQWRNERNEK